MIYGIIGGMGSYATVHSFKRILDRFSSENDNDYPHIIIDNNPHIPSRVVATTTGKGKDGIIESINESIDKLRRCGVERAIIACNTAHAFFNHYADYITVVNIIEETISRLPEDKTTIVLGTRGTLKAGLFRGSRFKNPEENQQIVIDKAIKETKAGIINKETIAAMKTIMKKEGEIGNILVACTELSIFFNQHLQDTLIYDTLEIGIEALLKG